MESDEDELNNDQKDQIPDLSEIQLRTGKLVLNKIFRLTEKCFSVGTTCTLLEPHYFYYHRKWGVSIISWTLIQR